VPPVQDPLNCKAPPACGSVPPEGAVRATVQPVGGVVGCAQLTVTDATGPCPTALPPNTVYVFAPAAD